MSTDTLPRTHALCALMDRHARVARASVDRAVEQFGSAWSTAFESLLQHVYADDARLEAAVKGYGSFIMDSMRRQKRFEREREYPAKTYAEAAAEVYFNDEYMANNYLPGLLLSHYLWPHHFQQLEYFQSFFLAALHRRGVRRWAEVGVGTGLYTRLALQGLPESHGVGYDISPLSLRFTAQHVAAFGCDTRYTVRDQNILTDPPSTPVEAVLCIEVLEHLEDPVAMLRGLRAMVQPGGMLFVTAALNAGHADHIYLYREPADVLQQAAQAELHVEHCFFANAYAPAAPGIPVPSALAMVLRREA
jgi:hypothetical protein